MSLRIRLLIGILVLAAAGLLVLDVVSYRALEGHLDDRVDQQVESSARPLEFALRLKANGQGDLGLAARPQSADSDLIPDGGQSPGGRAGRPRGAAPELPPGTYGQLRTAAGQVLTSVSFDYGDSEQSSPDLSGELPVTGVGEPIEPVTVNSKEGDGKFRVAATTGPDGLVTVSAVPMGDTEETLEQLAVIEAIVTVSVLIALAGLGWWVIGIGLRPLKRIGETADEIAGGDLSKRIDDVNPNTEVGRLGITLNSMLTQIEEAFRQRKESEDRMRQFLADASHELRTPLASIRGYSELYRLGAIEEPDGLPTAMSRIESESMRMGELVDDLLALARLDEMPTPAREMVVLGPILEESVADLQATSPSHQISIETGGDLRTNGDPDQLRRAIANILRNAVVHTPDNTPIEVRASRSSDRLTIEVRDHGPGLPDGSEKTVFDRFWRDSESRTRDSGGAGIGLAIVAAIVDGHDGTVTAANAADGTGAIFTIELPAAA
ncbi:MAG: HAMP domain-containing sensor histidine kinase [Solirubrobacterales bacterium]